MSYYSTSVNDDVPSNGITLTLYSVAIPDAIYLSDPRRYTVHERNDNGVSSTLWQKVIAVVGRFGVGVSTESTYVMQVALYPELLSGGGGELKGTLLLRPRFNLL